MPSRPLTFQLLVVVGFVEVFKVFSQDRVQQRLPLTFQFLVAIFKASSQAKVYLPLLLSPDAANEAGVGVFRTFPRGKKVQRSPAR